MLKPLICLIANTVDKDFETTLKSVVNGCRLADHVMVVVSLAEEQAAVSIVESYASDGIAIDVISSSDGKTTHVQVLQIITERHDGQDLILIQSGVVVPLGWDARLCAVAQHDEKITTVSPLCDGVALFSLLHLEFQFQDLFSPDDVDKLLFGLSAKSYTESPCFYPGCFYFKKASLNMILANGSIEQGGGLLWWWEIASLVTLYGGLHVISDHLYVAQDRKKLGAISAFLQQQPRVVDFCTAHPLTGLRHAVNDALVRGASYHNVPGYDNRPVQLHLIHGWGGGLELWARNFCQSDHSRINLVLKSEGTWGAFGQRLVLYSSLNDVESLRSWDLSLPIRATEVTNLAYRQIFEQILTDFSVDAVIVSSLIGHSLDALCSGKKTIIVAHDYFPFCPSISITFNEICRSCTPGKMTECFKSNPQNIYFKNITPQQWLWLREAYVSRVLEEDIPIAVPTPSVEQNLVQLDSRFEGVKFYPIAHGFDFELPSIPNTEKRRTGTKLRVLILGSLAAQKGGDLLRACYADLLPLADLYLVGCGPEGHVWQGIAGVKITSSYDREELYDIVSEIQPDVGMLLSVCQETFSYTLSELMMMGIPPVATDLGAFSDRIQHRLNGFLMSPDPSSVVEMLSTLAVDRSLIDNVKHKLQSYRHRRLETMINDYHDMLPLGKKKGQAYVVTAGVFSLPPERIQVTSFQGIAFEQYLHLNKMFLYEKIASSPLLRGWQRTLSRKGVSVIYRFLSFCYRWLCKVKWRSSL